MHQTIPTEPIGSIPRPRELVDAIAASGGGNPLLDPLYELAIQDTLRCFEATGSPVVTDGEQRKFHNCWTYSVEGMSNSQPDGFRMPSCGGHTRQMPRLTGGPFRYTRYADSYLDFAHLHTIFPVKQAVISPSALSFMYPAADLPGYPREQFIDDLVREHETEIRACLRKGACKVQVDFTEARLAIRLDPTGNLLHRFIDLNNLALRRFSPAERARIGMHTCPASDAGGHGELDYSALLPSLFELMVGNFYIALAGEPDRARVLRVIRDHIRPGQRVFIGVTAPVDPRVEGAEEVRDSILEASRYISPAFLGTTDDCGFAPFCDDVFPSRDTAFRKIRARVDGTSMASRLLGGA